MPKITAPTVAEHRAAQRRALLSAASAIVGEDGVGAVTPRSVGERAGLARSSFYEYFSSKDELLAAVTAQAFAEWEEEVRAAVRAAPAGRERLHAYVAATMRMTADGRHALATGLREAGLSPQSRAAISAMHDDIVAPLQELLGELGVSDAANSAALVQGLLDAGVRLVGRGAAADQVTASITAMLDAGVTGGRPPLV